MAMVMAMVMAIVMTSYLRQGEGLSVHMHMLYK